MIPPDGGTVESLPETSWCEACGWRGPGVERCPDCESVWHVTEGERPPSLAPLGRQDPRIPASEWPRLDALRAQHGCEVRTGPAPLPFSVRLPEVE